MNTAQIQLHVLELDYKKGIFARENLSSGDLENVVLIARSLRAKTAQIKKYIQTL